MTIAFVRFVEHSLTSSRESPSQTITFWVLKQVIVSAIPLRYIGGPSLIKIPSVITSAMVGASGRTLNLGNLNHAKNN